MFWSCSEDVNLDVHMFWISSSDYFFLLISQVTRSDPRYLVCATPPTILADSFETLQVILSWSKFLYYPRINFCHFFHDVNLDIQCYQCLYIGGTMCTQLLLQFFTILFETLHVLMSWPGDMKK